MKVLVVSTFFDTHRGGLEIVAGALTRQLGMRGCHVRWLASNATAAPSDIEAVSVGAWNVAETRLGVPFPLFGPLAVHRILSEVRDAQVIMIHDGLYMSSVAAFLAAKALSKPVLLIQHIGHVPYAHPLLRALMTLGNRLVARPLLARADQVVFISETTQRFFADVRFKRSPKLVLNGVDANIFRPPADASDKSAARERLGLPMARPIALFVGRFVEKKGLALLHLAAQRRRDVTWVFAGWGNLDPGLWNLDHVHVRRDLSSADLAELYRAADVFVLPSRGEGFPLVVQEALACGLPAVCGAETVFADPAAACFLDGVETSGPGALERLCVALDRAFARNDADRRERSLFAHRQYSWTAAADRHYALLASLAAPVRALEGRLTVGVRLRKMG